MCVPVWYHTEKAEQKYSLHNHPENRALPVCRPECLHKAYPDRTGCSQENLAPFLRRPDIWDPDCTGYSRHSAAIIREFHAVKTLSSVWQAGAPPPVFLQCGQKRVKTRICQIFVWRRLGMLLPSKFPAFVILNRSQKAEPSACPRSSMISCGVNT